MGAFTWLCGEGLCVSAGAEEGGRDRNRDGQGPRPGSGDGALPLRPQSITSGFL